MIRAILIDDEVNCTDILSIQLAKHCSNVEVVAVCNSAKEGIEKIITLNPDVVFLDIEMPHMNGFRLLEQLTPFNFEVVFTTAYDEFAIKAFKVCATDYLLKPIDKTELINAVKKIEEKKSGHSHNTQVDQLLKLISSQSQEKKIALPTSDGMLFLKPFDVIRCESESNYTYVMLANGEKICVTKTLKQVEESLHGLSFFRVHQSHLVNLNHIIKYHRDDGGYIVTTDGTTITIARQRKEGFLEMFSKI